MSSYIISNISNKIQTKWNFFKGFFLIFPPVPNIQGNTGQRVRNRVDKCELHFNV